MTTLATTLSMEGQLTDVRQRVDIKGRHTTNNIQKEALDIKDVAYTVHSAKTQFLMDSLLTTSLKLSGTLLLLGGSLLLKIVTVYWVIVFLVILPFALAYLSHLLTILFEYHYTSMQDGGHGG